MPRSRRRPPRARRSDRGQSVERRYPRGHAAAQRLVRAVTPVLGLVVVEAVHLERLMPPCGSSAVPAADDGGGVAFRPSATTAAWRDRGRRRSAPWPRRRGRSKTRQAAYAVRNGVPSSSSPPMMSRSCAAASVVRPPMRRQRQLAKVGGTSVDVVSRCCRSILRATDERRGRPQSPDGPRRRSRSSARSPTPRPYCG